MSVIKKLVASAALASAMFAGPAFAEDNVRIALVVKALGIGFFEAAAKGAEERCRRTWQCRDHLYRSDRHHRRGPD